MAFDFLSPHLSNSVAYSSVYSPTTTTSTTTSSIYSPQTTQSVVLNLNSPNSAINPSFNASLMPNSAQNPDTSSSPQVSSGASASAGTDKVATYILIGGALLGGYVLLKK